jgi:hypothetical protein
MFSKLAAKALSLDGKFTILQMPKKFSILTFFNQNANDTK